MCIPETFEKQYDEMLRPLILANVHESLWNDKCDYIDPSKCHDLNPTGFNLIALQLNIQSILQHSTELKSLFNMLECKSSRADIILLCETFLSKSIEKLVDIPNYTLISNHRVNSKGGGTAILVRKGISYKCQPSLEIFEKKQLESTFIEVFSKSGKK